MTLFEFYTWTNNSSEELEDEPKLWLQQISYLYYYNHRYSGKRKLLHTIYRFSIIHSWLKYV